MATPFAPLKIQIAYFKSLTPKLYYSQEKILDFLHRIECAILAVFCLHKFGCRGNSLWSIENSDGIFQFADS